MFKTGRYIRLTILAVILCAVTGCLSPLTTRLPMFANDDLRRERRGFEFHDPLPDPNIGPELGLRPPDFNRPRSQARQAAEQRILFGLPFAPESIPAGSRQGGLSRPNAL